VRTFDAARRVRPAGILTGVTGQPELADLTKVEQRLATAARAGRMPSASSSDRGSAHAAGVITAALADASGRRISSQA
jgi:hypothetical protein